MECTRMSRGVLLTSHMPAIVSRAAVAGAAYRTKFGAQNVVRVELGVHLESDVRSAASLRRAALTACTRALCRLPSLAPSDASSTASTASAHGSATKMFRLDCYDASNIPPNEFPRGAGMIGTASLSASYVTTSDGACDGAQAAGRGPLAATPAACRRTDTWAACRPLLGQPAAVPRPQQLMSRAHAASRQYASEYK